MSEFRTVSTLRQGQMIWDYQPVGDFVTLTYRDLVLESEADVGWFIRECALFWQRFDSATGAAEHVRKDLLVDLSGIIVKPNAANAWNAARAYMAEKYLRKTYRFGGERRTVTAIHLGQVLQRTEGTIYADREQALAALVADRAAAKPR